MLYHHYDWHMYVVYVNGNKSIEDEIRGYHVDKTKYRVMCVGMLLDTKLKFVHGIYPNVPYSYILRNNSNSKYVSTKY